MRRIILREIVVSVQFRGEGVDGIRFVLPANRLYVGDVRRVIKQLGQAGAEMGKVPGWRFHCAMEVDGAVSVFDVWDSMEQFQKFGETLVPIMKKLGADPGQPQIMKVNNLKHG